MITIGICDDEVAYRENLKTICWYYLRTLDQEYEFAMFASGEEVLAYQGDMIHLLFLDIELPGMDGMQVMEQIQKRYLHILHQQKKPKTISQKNQSS